MKNECVSGVILILIGIKHFKFHKELTKMPRTDFDDGDARKFLEEG